jgi:hypothetical protein
MNVFISLWHGFYGEWKNSKIQRCKMQYLITSIKSNTCPSIMMKPLNLSKDG